MEVFNRSDLIKWVIDGITEKNYKDSFNILKLLNFCQNGMEIELNSDGSCCIGTHSFQSIKKMQEVFKRAIDSKFNDKQNEKIQELETNMLIGTEFTFRRNTYRFSINDLEKTEVSSSISQAITDIDQWMKCICNARTARKIYASREESNIDVLINATNRRTPKNKILYSSGSDQLFWVNFALDTDCIELQTKPVPIVFYLEHQLWLQNDLFTIPQSISIAPDINYDTGGGGHITIDLASSFGDNAIGLRNFIILYHMFAKFNDSVLGECRDVDNAPFMDDVDEISEFRNVIQEFDGRANASMEDLVNMIQSRVYQNGTPRLKETLRMTMQGTEKQKAREIAGVLPHYQAINLENMQCGSSSRFELRRFNAQSSICELIEELNVIIALIYASNHSWKIPVQFLDYKENEFVSE